MKYLIVALLCSSCSFLSVLKSNSDRCFDLMEQTDGMANMVFKEGKKAVECKQSESRIYYREGDE